jgi:hypothetical protein
MGLGSWTLTVEVAWASQPMAASPSWTNITAYVLVASPIQVSVGRADEFSEVQPSTLSLLVNNSDGRFTLGKTDGAYGANVKIGRRIRVTATRSAVNYVRFDGHINNLPVEWPTGKATIAPVTITATDRLKRMSEAGELRSMVEHEILRDTPTCYYPLQEPSGSVSAADVTSGEQPAARIVQKNSGGAVDFGGQGPGSDSQAVDFAPASAGSGKRLEASPLTVAVQGAAVTLKGFVRCPPTVTLRMICALTNDTGTVLRLGIGVDNSLEAQLGDAEGNGYLLLSSDAGAGVIVNDDQWHHCAIKDNWNSGSPVATLYLDGVAVTSDISYSRTAVLSFSRLIVGGNKGGEHLEGAVAHVAGFSSGLADAAVLRHADAGLNGLAGERSDQRIGRVADYVAIPTADRQLDVGDSLVGQQNMAGRNAIEVMQEVTRTEGGVLFVNPADGKLTFHNRSRRYNAAVVATLAAASKQVAQGLGFPGDDFGMVNDETVTDADGHDARFLDQTSIDEYGLYRASKQVVTDSADDALQIAAWDVGSYGTPRVRTPSVIVDIRRLEATGPSLIATLLAATIGNKLRLTGLPSNAPASSVDVLIEGWAEEITSTTWKIAFNTSPAEVWDVWQLGVAGHSELGDTTRLGI